MRNKIKNAFMFLTLCATMCSVPLCAAADATEANDKVMVEIPGVTWQGINPSTGVPYDIWNWGGDRHAVLYKNGSPVQTTEFIVEFNHTITTDFKANWLPVNPNNSFAVVFGFDEAIKNKVDGIMSKGSYNGQAGVATQGTNNKYALIFGNESGDFRNNGITDTELCRFEASNTYNFRVSYIDKVLTMQVKKNDEESWHEYTKTASSDYVEKQNGCIALRERLQSGVPSATKLYIDIAQQLNSAQAMVNGEQPARAGSEIKLNVICADMPIEYSLALDVPDKITVLSDDSSVECDARCENNKDIIITLPQQLSFSTEYSVDLSAVKVEYTINDMVYERTLPDTVFTTNNGEKELALVAINNAATDGQMLEALNALNTFKDENERVDLFTDIYFTNAAEENEKLNARKTALAARILVYKNENGEFTKYDFSEVKEAAEKEVFILKIESYDNTDTVTEDLLEIFSGANAQDAEFYESTDKKVVVAGFMKELKGQSTVNTLDELKAYEKKARSISVASLAENDDLEGVLDNTEKYDFEGIIDLTSEDYTKNKSAVVKLMTGFRKDDFTYYATVDEFKNDFAKASGIACINTAESRQDITDAIAKYGEMMKLDLTEYKKYDANLVNIPLLDKKPFATVADIQAAINASTSALKTNSGSTTPSTGTSRPSSSGGGGGSSIAPSNTQITPTVTEKPSVDKPVESTNKFNDIDSVPWARDAINALSSAGKINGVGEDTFAPNRNITRAEFAKLVTSIFDIKSDNAVKFNDVKETNWYYGAVTAAAGAGIIVGDNGEFMPDKALTRQDMCVMLYRLLKDTDKLPKQGSADFFEDFNDVSDYAREAVSSLYANGFVSGVSENRFEPRRNTTRAEAAVLLYRITQQ